MKKILCIVLSVVMLSALCGVAMFAVAEEAAVIPESASCGESYKLPSSVQVDGQSVAVTARVTSPSGNSYTSTKLTLDEVGKYTIDYLANGKIVHTQTCVSVRRSTDMFITNDFATVRGIQDYKETTAKKLTGVQFDVRANANIQFDREFDMTNRTKNDVLTSIAIQPTKTGSQDFGQMIVTFTDVEDSSVAITVICSYGGLDGATSGGITFVRAGGDGQTPGGYEFKGGEWIFMTTEIYGAPAPFSFSGDTYGGSSIYDFACNLCYDTEENAMYLKNGFSAWYGEPYLICDFDDMSVHGTNIWNGFPSGKATMTVTFERFVSSKGSVIFTEVDTINLASESIVDSAAPEISIDYNGEQRVPNAFVGAKYNLFKATAVDFLDGDTTVETNVYFVDNSGAKFNVTVEDGKFVTDRVGKYEIVYTSSDKTGNVATQTVEVYCVGKASDIVFSGHVETINAKLCDTIQLIDVESLRCVGGSGNLTRSLTVYDPEGNVVELTDNKFVPTKVGTYTAKYEAVDFFGSKGTATTTIVVSVIDKPVFLEEISLPAVLVKGFTYDLPEIPAVYYNGTTMFDAKVEYIVDGKKVENGKFTVVADGSLDIECRAYDGNGKDYTSLTKTLPVVDTNGAKAQEKYFYNGNGAVETVLQKDAVDFNVNKNGTVQFANKLVSNSVELSFSYQADKVNFGTFKITLASASNVGQTVSFDLNIAAAGITMTPSGMDKIVLSTKKTGDTSYFALKYTSKKYAITDVNDTVTCMLKYYDDGTEFKGFDGGVYVTFTFSGVKSASTLTLSSINNQPLGYKSSADKPAGDKIVPQIVINGSYEPRFNLGDSVTIWTADAFDVLSQIETFGVTVYDPQNNIVLNNADPSQLHTVELNKIGRWRVIYSAKDTAGNSKGGNVGAAFTVIDNVVPELEVKNNLKKVYKVGDKIKIPSFKVSDNNGNISCDVFVLFPNNEIRLLTHYNNGTTTSYLSKADVNYPNSFKVSDDTFLLEQEGTHKLVFFAYDDAYNYVRYEIEFVVVA